MDTESVNRIRELLFIPLNDYNFTKYITEYPNTIKLLIVDEFESKTGLTKDELANIKTNNEKEHFERVLERLYTHTGEREVAKTFSEKWGETINRKNFTKKKKFYKFLQSIKEGDSTKTIQILKACGGEGVEIAANALDKVFKPYCSLRHPLKHYVVIKTLKKSQENYQIIHSLDSHSKYFQLTWQLIIRFNFHTPHKLKSSIDLFISELTWKKDVFLDSEIDEAIRQLVSSFSPIPVFEQPSLLDDSENDDVARIDSSDDLRSVDESKRAISTSNSSWSFQNQNKKNVTPFLIGNNRQISGNFPHSKSSFQLSSRSPPLPTLTIDDDNIDDDDEDDLPILSNNNKKNRREKKDNKEYKERKEKKESKEKMKRMKLEVSNLQNPILLPGEIIQIQSEVFLEYVEKVDQDISNEKKKNKSITSRFVGKGNLKKEKKSKKSSIHGFLILTNYQLIFLSSESETSSSSRPTSSSSSSSSKPTSTPTPFPSPSHFDHSSTHSLSNQNPNTIYNHIYLSSNHNYNNINYNNYNNNNININNNNINNKENMKEQFEGGKREYIGGKVQSDCAEKLNLPPRIRRIRSSEGTPLLYSSSDLSSDDDSSSDLPADLHLQTDYFRAHQQQRKVRQSLNVKLLEDISNIKSEEEAMEDELDRYHLLAIQKSNVKSKEQIYIPFLMIYRLDKIKSNTSYSLEISCKDFRDIKFSFESYPVLVEFIERTKIFFPTTETEIFAFRYCDFYNKSITKDGISRSQLINGWKIFNSKKELQRIIGNDVSWKIIKQDSHYSICDTYPLYFAIPQSITDSELLKVKEFRSRGRLPALCWRHPHLRSALTRCSQPKVGLRGARCLEDEKFLFELMIINQSDPFVNTSPHSSQSLIHTNNNNNNNNINNINNNNISNNSPALSNSGNANINVNNNNNMNNNNNEYTPLYLLDARPKANAMANQAVGAGFEDTSRYKNIKLRFLNIPNIHVMRDAERKLHDLCLPSDSKSADSNWLSNLESAHWLQYINLLLRSAVRITDLLCNSINVLIHCSDGWDRTSQLSSLSMLLMDPYYRSLEGFIVLIEKEWLSFGHKFRDRSGHIYSEEKEWSESETSPIFLQFIDSVWQLIEQFPSEFEFNSKLLVFLLDHLNSGQFGTFLCNSEYQRKEKKLKENTISVWTHVLEYQTLYTNPFYRPPLGDLQRQCSISLIRPSTSMKMTKFWTDYYLRFDSSIPKSIGEKESWGWEKLSLLSKIAMDFESIVSHADEQYNKNSNRDSNEKLQTPGGKYLLKRIDDLIEMEVQRRLKTLEKKPTP